MNKTKIEWTDYSWNPIKGICPVGCWYCYASKIYKRFNILNHYVLHDPFNERNYDIKEDELLFEPEILDENEIPLLPKFPKKPSKIFVCSTIELFHPKIKEEWRTWIFSEIKKHPEHTFQILTKFPQNINRPMPNNVWLGVTVTKDEDIWRRNRLVTTNARIKFISFEPLLEKLDFGLYNEIDWIIIGRLTQHGNKYNPKINWINRIVRAC